MAIRAVGECLGRSKREGVGVGVVVAVSSWSGNPGGERGDISRITHFTQVA